MNIIDGKQISQEILDKLKPFFQKKKVAVAIVTVGDEKATEIFIKQKQKAAAYLSIEFLNFHFDEKISNNLLRQKINEISRRNFIKGVVIQLPLAPKFNANSLTNVIPMEKDIDVLNERHFAQFCLGRSKILPPAVASLKFIFDKYNVQLKDKICGVVGLGRLIGFPISIWLMKQKTTIFAVDINTKNPQKIIKKCDIVISGVGQAGLIDKKWLKNGAIVIDFGFERNENGIFGDVNFDSAKKRADLITPTPGGMGPILVAILFYNLKELLQSKIKTK